MLFIKDAIQEATASLVGKLQLLEKLYADNGFKAYVVFQNPEQQAIVEELADKLGTSLPLTLLKGGLTGEGGQAYKLNAEAENTVLVTKNNKVLANQVNVKPQTFVQVALEAAKMLTASP